jgi:hypothetical protein
MLTITVEALPLAEPMKYPNISGYVGLSWVFFAYAEQ